jgi:DNA phosphorothioation-associated putative methyltransferase
MNPIGKEVGDNVYIHLTEVGRLSAELQELIGRALDLIPQNERTAPNVAKIGLRGQRVSLLEYSEFEEDPFPVLKASWTMPRVDSPTLNFRSYELSGNAPILHRKELLVSRLHPKYEEWAKLTETCEALGLFEQSKTIGFVLNWERSIASKGFRLAGSELLPIGNEESDADAKGFHLSEKTSIQRHLTAMSRTSLSGPVQMLIRHGLIKKDELFFDYGCGRGDDLSSLAEAGYLAAGWDPHYAPANELPVAAHAVNLGFVVNVIEDPAERVEAITKAFHIASGVLSVGVMLYGPERGGKPYGDGVLTTRGTFQKYFSQGELKEYLEQVLHQEAFLVAPGIAFVFADKELEQSFLSARYRSKGIDRGLVLQSRRLLAKREPKRIPRTTSNKVRLDAARPVLDLYWQTAIALGRYPAIDELPAEFKFNGAAPSIRRIKRLIQAHYPLEVLEKARGARSDDLKLYLALQHFSKRPRYRQLEPRLQRDINDFFGDYGTAQSAGLQLLKYASDSEKIQAQCKKAAELGLGEYDDGHSLQLHVELVDRLPVLLRVYVACAMVLTEGLSTAKLVKIHVNSGKLSLMEFEGFDETPLPLMTSRIKVNLKKLTYDLFEYGEEFPKPFLYRKSRYLNEDSPHFAEQLAFDEVLEATGVLGNEKYGPRPDELTQRLNQARLMVSGWELVPCNTVPSLDAPCGAYLTYRDFIECGETQLRLEYPNIPKRPETYNSLYGLATNVLDPLIEYFGLIRLTYGFCSHGLSQQIKERIAPPLDQHASEERRPNGALICSRGGAACDFSVDDEDMREVALWAIKNLPFDRLYYYGADRPIHISWSRNPSSKAYDMHLMESGRRMPRPFK